VPKGGRRGKARRAADAVGTAPASAVSLAGLPGRSPPGALRIALGAAWLRAAPGALCRWRRAQACCARAGWAAGA
jgi:hypothetical protein